MDPDEIKQIVSTIRDLPLDAGLKFLAFKGLLDLGKQGYESIRSIVREKVSKRNFGFVPNATEDNYLGKVADKAYYREFHSVLPKHRYSDLIRVGYLISFLNKAGGNKHRQRVDEIREQIKNTPNGRHSIKIINLVTTGGIVPVVDYLGELKRNNYDEDYRNNVFDEIISDWKKYSIFVEAETKEEDIMKLIEFAMLDKQKLIMVFARGSAKECTTKAIAEMLKKPISNGYHYDSKNNTEGEKEVHSSTFSLMDT